MKTKNIQAGLDKFLDDKVAGLDQNIKIVILAVVVIVPVIAFWFLSYSPQQKEIKKLESKKVALLKTIREVETAAAEIGKHRAEMAEAKQMFQMASSLLPQKQEIPALLTSISDLGSNSGLEILSFRPGGEAPKSFYAEIPFDISVLGSYHNMGVFLDKVSKMPRIVSVSSLALSNPTEDQGEMILKSSIKLMTYRFVEKQKVENKQKKGRKRR